VKRKAESDSFPDTSLSPGKTLYLFNQISPKNSFNVGLLLGGFLFLRASFLQLHINNLEVFDTLGFIFFFFFTLRLIPLLASSIVKERSDTNLT
jgi:hypothetical protein